MYTTIYLPTVSWTTLKKNESRLTGAEMRYFGKCRKKQGEIVMEIAKLE
jgi:hypothetical protein